MAAVQALLDDLDANSLCCAAESNQVEIVKYLARQPNVHISAKGRKGKTALQLALELGHHDIGKFLSKCHAASRIRSSTPIKFLTSFHTHRPQTVNVHTL
jgi:ankyrin repeat protein